MPTVAPEQLEQINVLLNHARALERNTTDHMDKVYRAAEGAASEWIIASSLQDETLVEHDLLASYEFHSEDELRSAAQTIPEMLDGRKRLGEAAFNFVQATTAA